MSDRILLLREKLAFFYEELAKTADVEQKFAIRKRLEETQATLTELEGRPAPTSEPDGAEEPPADPDAPPRLKTWLPPPLPALPYPVLLPYTHPDLLAGRKQDLVRLRRLLAMPIPILGLSAPSGTGKSSLLLGALVPTLRAERRPVAIVRHPGEGGVARRLLGDLLEDAPNLEDDERDAFVDRIETAERLAQGPPLLVLDQFEDVLRPGGAAARATLGPLIAATIAGRSASDAPRCRWLLGYREEFHGEVHRWLADVLDGAAGDVGGLPRDLSGPDRCHHPPFTLKPLGTAAAGREPLAEATRVFQEAIERPLALTTTDGAAVYPWRFANGHAERLARAFADVRLDRPDAPLTPELQVVLAHLLERAESGVVEVPEDTVGLVDAALEEHLRRGLERAFPGKAARTERARALLVLAELASDDVRRVGLRHDEIARALASTGSADDGAEVQEKLASPLTRLVVARNDPDGRRYVLPHDRLAEAIRRVVEQEGGRARLAAVVDARLLELRRFVSLKTALWGSHGDEATRLGRQYRRIEAHTEALLWDEERRAWWEACRKRRTTDRRRTLLRACASFVVVALVAVSVGIVALRRTGDQGRLEQIAGGSPQDGLQALLEMMPKKDDATLLALLRKRTSPMDVLEGLRGEEPSDEILQVVEMALPWTEDSPEDPVLLTRLAWALDYTAARDPTVAGRALSLRESVLSPLRKLRPPPQAESEDWIKVPAGTFQMARPGGEGDDSEHPQHEVTLSAFRLLRHEVTSAEYKQLVPDHFRLGKDAVPVAFVNWYDAYTYAAWIGGRLPTEAEWEYAARAECEHRYCRRDGSEAQVEEVAWVLSNSGAWPQPVMHLEPNPWGLYDMLGNLWEWTADWHGAYAETSRGDPWGLPSYDRRVVRGGSFRNDAKRTRVAGSGWVPPDSELDNLGFRVVLAGGR